MLGLSAITFLILAVVPRPRTKAEQREYLIYEVSKEFRNVCQKIVDSQWRPTSKFDKNDLKKALGIGRLPKPKYVKKFESEDSFVLNIKENFMIKINIVSGMMNTGGGMSYQTFEFSGYEFGSCKLFEGETECANFNYKHRFIHWLTEEFEDVTGFIDRSENLENYLDVEDRKINAWVKAATGK